MDEQTTKPSSSFVNTATQKTVRLKPMVKQPVVNIGQPTKVSSVSTNSQPLATSVLEAKNDVNTTRPTPLPATATMPVKKISVTGRQVAGSSILNSLNLKSKEAATATPVAPVESKAATGTNTTVVSKVKIANNVSEAFKDTIASSVAPTQKFVPTSNLDTSTSKVKKIDLDNANADTNDDKTVKLQRPERKQATVANTIVPALAEKTEEPKVEAAVENTETVAVNKIAAPATPKINIAPKVAPVVTPEVAPKAPEASKAPTVKLSLGKKETPAETPAEAPKIPSLPQKETAEVSEAKPKIGIAKKEEKVEVKPEVKNEENIDLKKPEVAPAETQVKIIKSKNNVSPLRSTAYMVIMVIVLILIGFAAAISAIKYLNTYEQERVMKGKVIEIPVLDEAVRK